MMPRLVGAVALLSLALGACSSEPVAAPVPPTGTMARLLLSDATVTAGDTTVVTLELTPGHGAVLATLRFDAERWSFLGQRPTPYLALVDDRAAPRGRLHISAVTAAGLPERVVELHFVARKPGEAAFALELHEAVRTDLQTVQGTERLVAPPAVRATRRRDAVERISAAEWVRRLSGGAEELALLAPGDGTIYGDVTQNGVVTSGDLVVIANVAVGNLELLQPERDLPIAGNVAPTNLPGLGEDGDPVPPGLNPDGSRSITAGDQLLVANHIVGTVVPVVGRPIPGRDSPIGLRPRVLLIDDTLRADRVFTADTVYEVRGSLVVGDLVPRAEGRAVATLRIRPGTRVEFEPSTGGRLIVATGSRLDAVGTLLQPIVFTCANGNAFAGCWGGVHLNGFALLNNSEQIGSPLKTGPGGTGTYGGIQQADSSGALRFVRIEYAGRPTVDGTRLAGLQLLGVGARTSIEHLQVHQAAGDGIYVSGGTARLRRVLLSDNRGTALRWSDGWTGRVQYLIAQQGTASGDAFAGENGPSETSGPRSAPIVSHVTVVGPAVTGQPVRTVRLARGSGGRFLNLVAHRPGSIGVDIDGDATCTFLAQFPDSAGVAAALFADADQGFARDAGDCLDEVAYGTAPERRNRVADPLLLAPLRTRSADFRPSDLSPATVGDSVPPADGFFETTARYLGAVPPATITRNGIPWYAGWTVGF